MRRHTRYDILQGRAPSGSVVRTKPDVLYHKEAFKKIYGYDPEEICDNRPKGYRRLVPPHENTIRALMRRHPRITRKQAVATAYHMVMESIRGW